MEFATHHWVLLVDAQGEASSEEGPAKIGNQQVGGSWRHLIEADDGGSQHSQQRCASTIKDLALDFYSQEIGSLGQHCLGLLAQHFATSCLYHQNGVRDSAKTSTLEALSKLWQRSVRNRCLEGRTDFVDNALLLHT